MSHTFIHIAMVNDECTQKKLDRRIYPLCFHQDFLGFELESLCLACFLLGGWYFNHCFFLFISGQVALCQLTHSIPALTVTNDMGVAGFIYLSTEKIKEEEIKFFLRMLDWHFYRWEKWKPREGPVNWLGRGLEDLLS